MILLLITNMSLSASFLLPVDGGWGDWSDWSKCSVTCGGGELIRERKCNNPKPAADGKDCEGDEAETKECNPQVCRRK